MITELHIFDFDGTLIDSSHRYRTQQTEQGEKIDLQYWVDNEHKTLDDKPLPLLEKFKELASDPTQYTIIATARIWCALSAQFAARHGIKPQKIVSRRDRSDSRGGAALKIQGVKPLLNLNGFKNIHTVHVYEDNANYLDDVSAAFSARFNVVKHFYPSNQGH